MTTVQLMGIIIIMFGLLGFSFLVIKEKSVSKKTKLKTLIIVTLLCMAGTALVEFHNAPSEHTTDMLQTGDSLYY